jgi:hypothetical protein
VAVLVVAFMAVLVALAARAVAVVTRLGLVVLEPVIKVLLVVMRFPVGKRQAVALVVVELVGLDLITEQLVRFLAVPESLLRLLGLRLRERLVGPVLHHWPVLVQRGGLTLELGVVEVVALQTGLAAMAVLVLWLLKFLILIRRPLVLELPRP